ncbi:MAG: CHASE3 domain-containing protein [Acidobacteriia bacterium]|nr:CHASE3 domain-containing protein [Terriglobia bacterium]
MSRFTLSLRRFTASDSAINIGFGIALAILVAIGVGALLSTDHLVQSQQWVTHTQEVVANLENLLSELNDAESARRGFILFGGERELDPYYLAVRSIPEKIKELQDLAVDDPHQQQRLASLEPLVRRRLAVLAESINLKRTRRPSASRQIELTDKGRRLTNRIAATIKNMEDEENKLLDERRDAARAKHRRTNSVLFVSSLASISLLIAVFLMLNVEISRRRQGEELMSGFFSASPVGLTILDLDLRYQRINQTMASISNVPAQEHIGKTAQEILRELTPQFEAPLMEVMVSQKPVMNWEISGPRPGRPEEIGFWEAAFFPVTDGKGNIQQLGAVVLDVTERTRAEESLRRLSGRLLKLQDEERRRIARELHDSIGQSIAAIKMNLETVEGHTGATEPSVRKVLSQSLALAEQCSKDMRTISYLLHPPLLDELGLVSAIRWFADGFAERSGIRVELDLPPVLERLPQDSETALFRIVQESLTNIHRHAGSPTATVSLYSDAEFVTLEVKDEGRGIPPELLHSSFNGKNSVFGVGINGMKERIRQLGGQLDITSNDHGTTVQAILPSGGQS